MKISAPEFVKSPILGGSDHLAFVGVLIEIAAKSSGATHRVKKEEDSSGYFGELDYRYSVSQPHQFPQSISLGEK